MDCIISLCFLVTELKSAIILRSHETSELSPLVVLNVPEIKRRPFPKPRSLWTGPFIFYTTKYWRLPCSQGKKTLPSPSNKQAKKHEKEKRRKTKTIKLLQVFSSLDLKTKFVKGSAEIGQRIGNKQLSCLQNFSNSDLKTHTLQQSSWDKPKNWIKQLTCLQVFSRSDLKNNLGKEVAEISQEWLSFISLQDSFFILKVPSNR